MSHPFWGEADSQFVTQAGLKEIRLPVPQSTQLKDVHQHPGAPSYYYKKYGRARQGLVVRQRLVDL